MKPSTHSSSQPSRAAAYTQGSIGRMMLKTAVPMLAGTLAMSGYNIVDTYFVGQLGRTSLAAMGYTFPLVMLVICLLRGFGVGVMATTAQALGQGRRPRAAALVTAGLWLVFLVSLVLTGLGLWGSDFLFQLTGAKGEARIEAVEYMTIWFAGCFTAAIQMVSCDLLIATGRTRCAGGFLMGGLLLNIGLDPLFIFTFDLGLYGAAWATVIAQGCTAFASMYVLYRYDELLQIRRFPIGELLHVWHHVVRYAMPAVLGMIMIPIGSAMLTWITAHFGDAAVAATAAAMRLEQVAFVFPMSLGMSLVPMIAQNYGAGLYDRIRQCLRFSTLVAGGFLLGSAVVYTLLAPWMVPFFSKDLDVQRIMILCLYIIPWGFAGTEIHRYAGFFYMGCKRPHAAAWLSAFRIFGLLIPLSLLALFYNSLIGLFYARLLTDILAGLVGWILSYRLAHTSID